MRTVRDHETEIDRLASEAKVSLFIVSPFVTRIAKDVFHAAGEVQRRLLTRLNPQDFAAGASNAAVLRDLVRDGVQVKTLRGLHAKVYMADGNSAVVTSANLTNHGLSADGYEYGVHVTHEECPRLFEEMEEVWNGQELLVTTDAIDKAERTGREFKAALPEMHLNEPADQSEPLRHQDANGRRIRTTGVVPVDIVQRFQKGASDDERFGAGLDYDSIITELRESNRQAISIRSFLWLVGWCNTGRSFERSSVDIAQPLARDLFGYVPGRYLDGRDLKLARYRGSVGKDLEDAIVAEHEGRLKRG